MKQYIADYSAVDHANNKAEAVDTLARIQARDARIVLDTIDDEAHRDAIAAVLATPVDVPDEGLRAPSRAMVAAANEARRYHDIYDIVFNSSGHVRGSGAAGNTKGSRAAKRTAREARAAKRAANSAMLDAYRKAQTTD